ncbi:hypothetical protein [Humisphaera borealis]|uniref:DUF4398 domain-containing protein n=1 Tax=Humisphaera borealis TaxID=2807512 RepID=A0A7M2WTS9_9BACT|nr:hypothetical protein [Humisphaera borealis]QOV88552.1 hypothetical protein IPV69_20245 [Humisphaera borealis]
MHYRKHFVRVLAGVTLLAACCLAVDEPKPAAPKSAAALAAIARHERALADATRAYEQAKQKAREELLADLKKAQADVLKTGGASALSEGNAI